MANVAMPQSPSDQSAAAYHKPVLPEHTNQKPHHSANSELIPIYTEWANHHLAKANTKPIIDLTGDLCNPKRLVGLISAITCDSRASASRETLLCALNSADPVESIEKCLKYLAGLGVNVSSIQAKDIRKGHLGVILSLLFSLSYFKQQQKAALRLTVSTTRSTPTELKEPSPVPSNNQLSAASPLKGKRSKKPTSNHIKTQSSSSGYSSFNYELIEQSQENDLATNVEIVVTHCAQKHNHHNKKSKRDLAACKKPDGLKKVAFRMPPNSSSTIVSTSSHDSVDPRNIMEESRTSTTCVVGSLNPSSSLRPPSSIASRSGSIPKASKLAAPSLIGTARAAGPAKSSIAAPQLLEKDPATLSLPTAKPLTLSTTPVLPSLLPPSIQTARQVSKLPATSRVTKEPAKADGDSVAVSIEKIASDVHTSQSESKSSNSPLNDTSVSSIVPPKLPAQSQISQRSRPKVVSSLSKTSCLRPPSATRLSTKSSAQLPETDNHERMVSPDNSRADCPSAVPAPNCAGITEPKAEQQTSASDMPRMKLFGGKEGVAKKSLQTPSLTTSKSRLLLAATTAAAVKTPIDKVTGKTTESKASAEKGLNTVSSTPTQCNVVEGESKLLQKKRAISSPQLVRKTKLMQPNSVACANPANNNSVDKQAVAGKTLLPPSCLHIASISTPSLLPPSTSSKLNSSSGTLRQDQAGSVSSQCSSNSSSSSTSSPSISTTSAPPPSLDQSSSSSSSSFVESECKDKKEVLKSESKKQVQRPISRISAPCRQASKIQQAEDINTAKALEFQKDSGMVSDAGISPTGVKTGEASTISPQQEKRPVLAVKGISVQIQKKPELEDELQRHEQSLAAPRQISNNPSTGTQIEVEQVEAKSNNIGIVSPMLQKPMEAGFGFQKEQEAVIRKTEENIAQAANDSHAFVFKEPAAVKRRDPPPSVPIRTTPEKIESASVSRIAKVAHAKSKEVPESTLNGKDGVLELDLKRREYCTSSPVPPPPVLSLALQRNSIKVEDVTISKTSQMQGVGDAKKVYEDGRVYEKVPSNVGRRRHHDYSNDSYEDSSSISSSVSETFDDISTDDLTGSSSDYLPAASNPSSAHNMAVFGEVNKSSSQQISYGDRSASHHHRLSSHSSQHQNAVDELLQRCRTSQRGVAFYSEQTRRPASSTTTTSHSARQLDPVDYYQLQQQRGAFPADPFPRQHYHTIHVPPNNLPGRQPPPRILSPPPHRQLTLYGDAEGMMSVNSNKSNFGRSSHRRQKSQMHPTPHLYNETAETGNKRQGEDLYQQSPTIAYHTHSLDRHSHLKIFSLASTSNNGSAGEADLLLSAPSSPYRLPMHSNAVIQPADRHNMMLGHGYGGDQGSISRHSSGSMSARVASNEPSFHQHHHSASSSIYANHGGLHLHKLSSSQPSGELTTSNVSSHSSPAHLKDNNIYLNFKSPNPQGAYSSMEEKYGMEMRKLLHEMDTYRSTILQLSAKHEDYNHLIHMFDGKLGLMVRHVEKLQQKSQFKQEEIDKLRQQIEHLRLMSCNAGLNLPPTQSNGGIGHLDGGAGEQLLLRRPCSPSGESVLSQRSFTSAISTASNVTNKIPKLAFPLLNSSNGSTGKNASTTDKEVDGVKSGKKSWIRSSFNKAFHKAAGSNGSSNGKKSKLNPPTNGSVSDIEHSPMHSARSGRNGGSMASTSTGSTTRLENLDPNTLIPLVQMVELKKQLEDKDLALTDVRLDALDKAREVDILRETVHRLKNENKILKHNFTVLERRIRDDSRASSHQSLSTCCQDEQQYDMPGGSCTGSGTASVKGSTSGFAAALSVAESRCHSSSSSSKRSSGGVNIRVTLCVDLSGKLEFGQPVCNPIANSSSSSPHVGGSSSTISSTASFASSNASNANNNKRELTIGYLGISSVQNFTWEDMDQQLGLLLEEYLHRIDPDMTLGVDSYSSIIGYQLLGHGSRGAPEETVLRTRAVNSEAKAPVQTPAEVLSNTVVVKLRLQGAVQDSMDALVLESLFPKSTLEQLLNSLLQSRRLVIYGATGIGKSNLARYLAKYLAEHLKVDSRNVSDFRFPDDDKDLRIQQVQQQLIGALKMEKGEQQILLLDNIQRKRIELMTAAFLTADQATASNDSHSQESFGARELKGSSTSKRPFVIVTLNRTSESPVQNLQVHHGFKLFSLNSKMDAVKGYMGRYLRRRIAEEELSGGSHHFRSVTSTTSNSEQLQCVIEFLNRVLNVVNDFIEKANAFDVTLGPRIFLQCPLNMEDSRMWFIELWNEKIVPYMTKVARDSMNFLGSRGILKDPTLYVCEHWPWFDADSGAGVLRHILPMMEPGFEAGDSARKAGMKQHRSGGSIVGNVTMNAAVFPAAVPADFDPIYALERIEESRKI